MKRTHSKGFTLIEMMITVVVVSILSAIAIPAYSHYVLRGKLSEAPNTLASQRILMEQYYQDNKNYGSSSTCGLSAPPGTNFQYSCVLGAGGTSYTWTATGLNQANGYSYSVDDQNFTKTLTVGTGARCSTSNSTWNTNC
jgi:type IV pilus assembly protein PilE